MGTRGRKSAAELAVAQVVEIVPRPVAPDDLTDEQAEEWQAVVSRMPADWFQRETHAMLSAYCRHVVSARRVAQLIKAQDESAAIDLDEYDKLLKMQEREGRAISSLATRMRISQQASYNALNSNTAKRKGGAKKPWQ